MHSSSFSAKDRWGGFLGCDVVGGWGDGKRGRIAWIGTIAKKKGGEAVEKTGLKNALDMKVEWVDMAMNQYSKNSCLTYNVS